MSQRVVLRGHAYAQYKEGQAGGTITPGMLIAITGGVDTDTATVNVQTTVGPTQVAVAVEPGFVGPLNNVVNSTNFLNGSGLGIDQNYLANDTVLYQTLDEGAEFLGLLAAGAAAVNFNDFMESAGDGTLRKATGGGTKATGSWNDTAGNVANGDTVTIGDVVYTFQTTLTNVAGNVHIGASAAASATNLANAINNTGGVAGTDYSNVGEPNPFATAVVDGVTNTKVDLTAVEAGSEGNSVALAKTGTNGAVSGALLTGGSGGGLGVSKLQARQTIDNSGGSSTVRVRVEVVN